MTSLIPQSILENIPDLYETERSLKKNKLKKAIRKIRR